MSTMRLAALWRHPVKSFQGESLDEAVIEAKGLAGDRVWGLRDEATGKILTARRIPPLLLAQARLNGATGPELTLPDGTTLTGTGPDVDAALSDWLGKPVRLVAAAEEPAGVGEFFADATDDTSEAIEWTMPEGRFVDALPLLLLTTATLRACERAYPEGEWDVRRFRPNLLIEADGDGYVEDAWLGKTVRVGDVELQPVAGCERCTMVTRPQPGLERDVDIFRTVLREHGGALGVWTAVRTPGTVRIGDPVEVDLS